MSSQSDEAKKLLRRFLNPAIQGPNTEAILDALSAGGAHLIQNVEAVHDSLYVVSASGRYLEQRLAEKGLTKPPSVGLDDDTFRQIGIAVSNRKQVRDLINNILEIIYGNEFTRAQTSSSTVEPFNLEDGDTLTFSFDDSSTYTITFNAEQFAFIAAATAQEVADSITKQLRSVGSDGFAFVKNDGSGNYVSISSPTTGPSSSIRVLGGRSQNVFKFPSIRATTGDSTTQWTVEAGTTGLVRMTWTGGTNPSIGKVTKGDYVNIFGSGFYPENQGTFTVVKAKGGLVNNSYIEISNPLATSQVTLQGSNDGVLFFEPTRRTIVSNINYAAAFQSESNVLEVFLPAITRVVRRERIGSAHVIDNPPFTINGEGEYGPYVFDPTKGFQISQYSTTNSIEINQGTENILTVADSSNFPDQAGFICINYGTELEEGPIPYLERPSKQTILLNPDYKIKNIHPVGSDISLIGLNSTYIPDFLGRDYPFYLTDVSSGRAYAEDLVNSVAAVGLTVIITILYPDPVGLSKWEETDSNKQEWKNVFGE